MRVQLRIYTTSDISFLFHSVERLDVILVKQQVVRIFNSLDKVIFVKHCFAVNQNFFVIPNNIFNLYSLSGSNVSLIFATITKVHNKRMIERLFGLRRNCNPIKIVLHDFSKGNSNKTSENRYSSRQKFFLTNLIVKLLPYFRNQSF